MTTTRKLIWAFWIFIIGMLIWEFYDYNESMTREAKENPKQEHFFFYHSNATAAPAAPALVHRDGADVKQVGYSVQSNAPSTGSFTINVTLKNVGNAKALDVQVRVRPYRGMRLGDEDVGHSALKTLDENDPLSQFGQSLGFPDLAPGQSNTQSVVFSNRQGATPVVQGSSSTGIPGAGALNLAPEISYTSEKPKQTPPHAGGGG